MGRAFGKDALSAHNNVYDKFVAGRIALFQKHVVEYEMDIVARTNALENAIETANKIKEELRLLMEQNA